MEPTETSNSFRYFARDARLLQVVEILAFVFPFAFIACMVYLKIDHRGFYHRHFLIEDSLGEYATCIAYLLASAITASLARRLDQDGERLYGFLYVLLFIGLLFIAMEEISWGQRILGLHTPKVLEEYNMQDEINLHNLLSRYPLHAMYILVGFYGSFARALVPRAVKRRYPAGVDLLTPKGSLVAYFFPVLALYLYYDYLSVVLVDWFGPQMGWGGWQDTQYFMQGNDQEPIELLLSLGFLLFVAVNWYRENALPQPSRARREES